MNSTNPSSELVTVIIPAAGDSFRPSGKPTWMLPHPKGYPLLLDMFLSLDLQYVSRVIVAVKKQHVDTFFSGSLQPFTQALTEAAATLTGQSKNHPVLEKKIEFFVMDIDAGSAPATVCHVINSCQIAGPIFIKDSDGKFPFVIVPGNYVVGLNISTANPALTISNLPMKSFVVHHNRIVSSIHEKKIMGDTICVGGYSFRSAEEFVKVFNQLSEIQSTAAMVLQGQQNTDLSSSSSVTNSSKVQATAQQKESSNMTDVSSPPSSPMTRVFSSTIIHFLILNYQVAFTVQLVTEFEDWKTNDAWRAFCKKHHNIVVALDGVLFVCNKTQQGQSSPWNRKNEDYLPVEQNIDYLQKMHHHEATRIIVATARPSWEREATESLLKSFNVPFDDVVYGLMRCTTYNIFGYGEEFEHPSTISYCIPDGSAQLGSILHFD